MMLKSQAHARMGWSRGPDSGTGVPALKGTAWATPLGLSDTPIGRLRGRYWPKVDIAVSYSINFVGAGEQPEHARDARSLSKSHVSVKLVRNASAVCDVEGGTVCLRVARGGEVAHRRHTSGPTATTCLPKV